MGIPIAGIVFDCDNALVLAEFWAGATGYVKQSVARNFASLSAPDQQAPSLLFIRVPEAKSVKNRVHIELRAINLEAEVEKLKRLGARELKTFEEQGTRWTVMADPEGNEFCVVHFPQANRN